ATRVCERSSELQRVVGLSLLGLFAFQVMVNVGVVLHLIPTTGMTLPFMSYGGTSTLALAILVGIILSLTRKESMKVMRRKR
ncbi:MAG: FtsW/RodA/SpoVE family cell cycle protein, partial [Alphaproteobacteria bacterium]|nr:FtsW/RodA/SpoVE family cell cycle protein [Alphaproteobacteria bacterium]